jgi:hypothetical protein
MAQCRPVAASKDSGHPSPLSRDQAVANGVDSMVDRVQQASSQPAFNPPSGQTQRFELPPCHDTVLRFREPRHPPVDGFAPRIG